MKYYFNLFFLITLLSHYNLLAQDSDGDGISDTIEAGICSSLSKSLTETSPIVDIDFGVVTGALPETDALKDPNVNANYKFENLPPIDGEYAVATSTFFDKGRDKSIDTFFVATNENNQWDADGNVNGRYIAINVLPSLGNEIYRLNNINVVQNTEYVFRIDMVGLCEDFRPGFCDPNIIPLLRMDIVQGSSILATTNSVIEGVSNDDIWVPIELRFSAISTGVVSLVITNSQPLTLGGNDVGIDNIRFSPLNCDFDRDGVPNVLDIDSDNDGIIDSLDGNFNSDSDGFPNFTDIDSDDDGIPDNVEAQDTFSYKAPSGIDIDGNGLDDAYESTPGAGEGLTPIMTNTTNPDFQTSNIDGDCLTDNIEVFDIDGDGISNTLISGIDVDQDGLDDAFDRFIYDPNTLSILPPKDTFVTNPTNDGILANGFPNIYDNDGTANDQPDFREALVNINEMLTIDICGRTLPIDLFNELSVANIPSGTWQGTPALTNGEDGRFDPPSSFTGYPVVYTYTIPPTDVSCVTRQGVVTINQTTASITGTSDTSIFICNDDTTRFTLISRFTTTPNSGGMWFDQSGTLFSADENVVFDPQVNSFETYTYRLGTAPCSSEASITVNRVSPNAGKNGNDQQFCFSNTSNISLLSLLQGSADNTGVWSNPSSATVAGGAAATINPSTATAGLYTYTVSETVNLVGGGTLTCTDTATVLISISRPPTISIIESSLNCLGDTYSVDYTISALGTITINSPSTATLNTTTQQISNVPLDQALVLMADSGGCTSIERYEAPTSPPSIELLTNGSLCVDNNGNVINGSNVEIQSGLPSSNFNFSWSLDGATLAFTTSSITVTTPGEYILTYNEIGVSNQCPREVSVVVNSVLSLGKISIDTGDDFLSNNFTVTINVDGVGLISYELEEVSTGNIINQMDNVFTNLRPGGYIIRVIDNTCGAIDDGRFFLVGFNPFFSPNGDGFNDTWNLIIENNSTLQNLELEVFIFDRFGRILQQFDPLTSLGFDGNYRGQPLPANDYWFLVKDKANGGEFRSHFTLRR